MKEKVIGLIYARAVCHVSFTSLDRLSGLVKNKVKCWNTPRIARSEKHSDLFKCDLERPARGNFLSAL